MAVIVSTLLLDNNKKFKAPRGTMYKVSSVVFLSLVALSAFVFCISRSLSTTQGNPDQVLNSQGDVFAGHDMTIAGVSFECTGIDEIMKTISISKTSTGACEVKIIIYGEIIPATRRELIIEWFRKR